MCLVVEDTDIDVHLGDGWRTARKPHNCVECRRQIGSGERYFYDTIVMDSRASTWRMCVHCRRTITLGSRLSGCPEMWWYGQVFSDDEAEGFMADIVKEHDLPSADRWRLLRCWAAARRGWRWRDGTLMEVPC